MPSPQPRSANKVTRATEEQLGSRALRVQGRKRQKWALASSDQERLGGGGGAAGLPELEEELCLRQSPGDPASWWQELTDQRRGRPLAMPPGEAVGMGCLGHEPSRGWVQGKRGPCHQDRPGRRQGLHGLLPPKKISKIPFKEILKILFYDYIRMKRNIIQVGL